MPTKNLPPKPPQIKPRVLNGSTEMIFINERSEVFNSSIDLTSDLSMNEVKQIGKLGIDIMTGNEQEVGTSDLLIFVQPSENIKIEDLKAESKVIVIHSDALRAWKGKS